MIALIGTGALSSLFAARLAPHTSVVMIGRWRPALEVINSRGLTLIGLDGTESNHKVRATSDAVAAGPASAAIVLVKSYQTVDAVGRVSDSLHESGVALTLQNGAGNLAPLREAIGDRATSGVTSMGATLIEPGVVRHAGDGPIHVAPPVAAIARPAFDGLLGMLRQAGFEVHLAERVDGLIWGKLAINAGINPLTCVLGVRNGFLAEHASCRRLLQAAADEVAAVASAQGITIPYADAAAAALEVARRTANNQSSMLQDRIRGRPTEIDAICGAVARAGAECGLRTSVNNLFLDWVRAATDGSADTDAGSD